MTNHPSYGNGTINGSGANTPPRGYARYWKIAGRYVLAWSREHAIERYLAGDGSATPPKHEHVPSARCVRAVFLTDAD